MNLPERKIGHQIIVIQKCPLVTIGRKVKMTESPDKKGGRLDIPGLKRYLDYWKDPFKETTRELFCQTDDSGRHTNGYRSFSRTTREYEGK